jgi:hypothetical protein
VVISSGPSEVDAEVFSETLCPLPALLFGGGRVPASASRFPPLGGGDAPVVLPILWAAAAATVVAPEAAVAAAAEVASTMVIGLPDIACAS